MNPQPIKCTWMHQNSSFPNLSASLERYKALADSDQVFKSYTHKKTYFRVKRHKGSELHLAHSKKITVFDIPAIE